MRILPNPHPPSVIESDPTTGEPRRRVVPSPAAKETMRDRLAAMGTQGNRKMMLALADLLDKVGVLGWWGGWGVRGWGVRGYEHGLDPNRHMV